MGHPTTHILELMVPVPDLVDENLQAERNLAIGPIPTKIGVFAD